MESFFFILISLLLMSVPEIFHWNRNGIKSTFSEPSESEKKILRILGFIIFIISLVKIFSN